jgi:hypothetical protein
MGEQYDEADSVVVDDRHRVVTRGRRVHAFPEAVRRDAG